MEKRYVYFFTRQDISPEQQIVQTAHVALILGTLMKDPTVVGACSPHFTVVGVRNLEALVGAQIILEKFDRKHVAFYEPDLDDEMTSIATYPIPEDERKELLAFSLLRL